MTDNAKGVEGWRQLIANLINAAETVGYWGNAKDSMPTEYRSALEVETVAAAALEKYIAAHNASDPTALDVAVEAYYVCDDCKSACHVYPVMNQDGWLASTCCSAEVEAVIASKHPGSEQKGG
jgi:hypothetical protein